MTLFVVESYFDHKTMLFVTIIDSFSIMFVECAYDNDDACCKITAFDINNAVKVIQKSDKMTSVSYPSPVRHNSLVCSH